MVLHQLKALKYLGHSRECGQHSEVVACQLFRLHQLGAAVRVDGYGCCPDWLRLNGAPRPHSGAHMLDMDSYIYEGTNPSCILEIYTLFYSSKKLNWFGAISVSNTSQLVQTSFITCKNIRGKSRFDADTNFSLPIISRLWCLGWRAHAVAEVVLLRLRLNYMPWMLLHCFQHERHVIPKTESAEQMRKK